MRRLHALVLAVALAGGVAAASLVTHAQQQPAASRARDRNRAGWRHSGPGGCRRSRQARDAGEGSAAVRLRGRRGRRGTDDRLVHADLRGGCPRLPPLPQHLRQPPRHQRLTLLRPRRSPQWACRSRALVFDRLSPEARQVAMKAAKTYLGDKKETPNYMGVFGIDLSLKSYTPSPGTPRSSGRASTASTAGHRHRLVSTRSG